MKAFSYYWQFVLIPIIWAWHFVDGIIGAFKNANWNTRQVIAEHKRHYGRGIK